MTQKRAPRGHAATNHVTEFQQGDRNVVLLTLREAKAIRKALREWAVERAALETDESDLGRGYRVLTNQIASDACRKTAYSRRVRRKDQVA